MRIGTLALSKCIYHAHQLPTIVMNTPLIISHGAPSVKLHQASTVPGSVTRVELKTTNEKKLAV